MRALIPALAFLFALPLSALDVALTITETGSMARTTWPASIGVPLTQADNITSTENLMVTANDGITKLPSQFRVLACWTSAPAAPIPPATSESTCVSGPIKVVLVDFQVPFVASGGTYTARLKDRSGADPAGPTLTVTSDASYVYVDTGTQFRISKTAFNFLDQVTVGGSNIVASGSGQKLYVTEGGTEYNSLNADAPVVSIARSGPMRAEIVVSGQLESAGGVAQALRYKAWLHFYAGSPRVTTYLRIVFDKDMMAFNPSDLAISLPLALGTNYTFQTQNGTSAMTTTDYAYLLQEDHGVAGTGWYHRKNAGTVASGGQSNGACGMYDAVYGVVAWKRWAWQEYPWECEATTGKVLRLGLWPVHSNYTALVATKKTEAQASGTINHIFPYRENETMDLRGVNESGTSWPDSPHNVIGMGKLWQLELEFHGATPLDADDRATAWAAPLYGVNSTAFTATGIFGPVGSCVSGLGVGNLVQDSEDTIATAFTYLRTTNQSRRNFGLFVYGDSQYDNAATTTRWWLMNRIDWNMVHALQFVRCGDRTTMDEAESINRHIGEMEIIQIDVPRFTDAAGRTVDKAIGGVVATHDVGNTHGNNCTWGKAAPCSPVNSEPMVDDASLGLRILHYLTGHDFYREDIIRRADALVTVGPPVPTGPRQISNLASLTVAYELTRTASYLTAANVIAAEAKLASGSGGMNVTPTGYLSAGDSQLGWSIFHAAWTTRALWHYYHVTGDGDTLTLLRRTGKAAAAADHDSDAHGAEQWFSATGFSIGAWAAHGSGSSASAKVARRVLMEALADKRAFTSNGGTQYWQNYAQVLVTMMANIKTLQDYGAWSGLARETNPVQNIRIPSGADLTFYVQEPTDQQIVLTYMVSTGASASPAFTPWSELGNLTVKAFNPAGTEIYSTVLTSTNIANTFSETIAGGTDGRYHTITLPTDATSGTYKITFNSSVAYNYVAPISVSTGKQVVYVPRSGSFGRLNRGIWYFQGPISTGTIHAHYSNFGGLVAPSGRVYSHNGSNQTLNTVDEEGIWGLIPGIPAEVHGSYTPYLRSSVSGAATSTKPLYAVSPDQYFDVGAVSVDTAAMPGPPYFIIANTDTGGAGSPTITSLCPLDPGNQNMVYSGYQFAANGGTPGYTWSIASGALPAGLTLSGGGAVTGTPTASGTFNFDIRATDALSATDTDACSIQIAASVPPTITAAPATAMQYNVAASGSYAATGDATISWSVFSGALPTGVGINSASGALTGTPTAIGNYVATIRATNGAGTADHTQTYIVRPGPAQGIGITVLRVSGTSAVVRFSRVGFDANSTIPIVIRHADPPDEIYATYIIPKGIATRTQVISGLSPHATYYIEAAAANVDGSMQFTTVPRSATSMAWSGSHPSAADALIEWGTDGSTFPNSVVAACAATLCSATMTNLTANQPVYFRHTWRTAGAATIATSSVVPAIP